MKVIGLKLNQLGALPSLPLPSSPPSPQKERFFPFLEMLKGMNRDKCKAMGNLAEDIYIIKTTEKGSVRITSQNIYYIKLKLKYSSNS